MSKLKISMVAEVSESAANPYLSADGLINVGAYAKLNTRIEAANKKVQTGLVAKAPNPAKVKQPKAATPILFTAKKAVPFSASLDKKGDHKYKTMRGQQVKGRKSMPAVGSKVRFVLLLSSLFEGADKALLAEAKKAQSAAAQHNKKALKVVDKVKTEKGKLREAENKVFEANVQELTNVLLAAGSKIKAANIIKSVGMFGTQVLVKLPGGGVVSIGKSDLKRFNMARKMASQSSETSISTKQETEAWAKEMGGIVKGLAPKVELGRGGMASSDGFVVKKDTGKKIIAAFKKSGYQPFEQTDNFWVISTKKDDTIGVTVDFRNDSGKEGSDAILAFYSDDN